MAIAPTSRLQPRPRLGDLLVRDGKITQAQLEEAMKDREALGGRLGRHLVDLGYLDEPALLDTLSRQMQIPIVDLDAPGVIEAGAERYARSDLAERWGFAPIQYNDRRQLLVIALSDPDPKLIRNIEEAIGRRVDVRIASSQSIERVLLRMYHPDQAQPAAPAPAGAPSLMKGLQLSRTAQKTAPVIESPWSDKTAPAVESPWSDPTLPKQPALDWSTPAPQPIPAAPPPPPVISRIAVDAKRYTASFEPDLEPPRESPPPPAPPPVRTPTLAPMASPVTDKAVESALIGSLRERILKLEEMLASQNRVMRSILDVLDEKGILTKIELARRHQSGGK